MKKLAPTPYFLLCIMKVLAFCTPVDRPLSTFMEHIQMFNYFEDHCTTILIIHELLKIFLRFWKKISIRKWKNVRNQM